MTSENLQGPYRMSKIYSKYPYSPFASFYWACTIPVRAFNFETNQYRNEATNFSQNIPDLTPPLGSPLDFTIFWTICRQLCYQGLGAVDMFIDDANPLNKPVHSSLATVKKKMERKQSMRG